MCQASLLSSTANLPMPSSPRSCFVTLIHRSKSQGPKHREGIFYSPEIESGASSHLFLHLVLWGKSFPSHSLLQPCSQVALHTPAEGEELLCGYQRRDHFSYLESVEICWFEVIRRTATPVNNVLVLTLATEFTVPVCDAQVVVHHGVTVRAIFQNSVKEGLQERQRGSVHSAPQTSIFSFTTARGPEPNASDLFSFEMRELTSSIVLPYMKSTLQVCNPRSMKKITTGYRLIQTVITSIQLRPCYNNLAQNNCTSAMTSFGYWESKGPQERHQSGNYFIFISAVRAIPWNSHYFSSVSYSLVRAIFLSNVLMIDLKLLPKTILKPLPSPWLLWKKYSIRQLFRGCLCLLHSEMHR